MRDPERGHERLGRAEGVELARCLSCGQQSCISQWIRCAVDDEADDARRSRPRRGRRRAAAAARRDARRATPPRHGPGDAEAWASATARTIAYLRRRARSRSRSGGGRRCSRARRSLLRDRRPARPDGRRKLRAGLDLLALPRDGVLELTHAGAERAADLRQPLGAEEEQGEERADRTISMGPMFGMDRIVAASSPVGARPVQIGVSREPSPRYAGRRSRLR